MKVPRIKFDSLHYIRFAVCTFQLLVSVRYRTKHQDHHSSEINSTPVPIVQYLSQNGWLVANYGMLINVNSVTRMM